MADDYIETLADGLHVLTWFMENLHTTDACTVKELSEKFPNYSRSKLTRLLATLHACGYLEFDDKKYRIGAKPLMLSHRRLQALYAEHQRIKREVEQLNIQP